MPAQLLALNGGEPIILDRPIMLFGRHPECDVQLNSRKVSRRHCCVAQLGDALVVRDLGSTNGVKINDQRVIEGRIQHGDELTVGNFRYQVCWENSANGKSAKVAKPLPAVAPVGRTVEDDVLEDCDEPIPLSEPMSTSKARAIPAAKAAPAPIPKPDPIPPSVRPPSGGFFIPDDIGLMPPSGEFPGRAPSTTDSSIG